MMSDSEYTPRRDAQHEVIRQVLYSCEDIGAKYPPEYHTNLIWELADEIVEALEELKRPS